MHQPSPLMLLIAGLIGVLFHHAVNLKNQNARNNGKINWGKYFQIERINIFISIAMCLFVSFFLYDYIMQIDWFAKASMLIMPFFGYVADSVLLAYVGKTQKFLEDKTGIKLQTNLDSMKDVAFFVRNPADTVKTIDGITYNQSCNDLAANVAGFSIQDDPDCVADLCTQVPDTTPSITGVFIDHSTSEEYTLASQDFVGGRPGSRPHLS